MADVKPGQVWADNDKRSEGRHVKVVDLVTKPKFGSRVAAECAKVVQCDQAGRVLGKPRYTTIRLDRFRSTSNGYRLVSEGEQ